MDNTWKFGSSIYLVGYLLIRLIKPPYILFIEYIAFGKLRIEAVQSSRHAFRVRLSVTYRLQSLGIDARRYEVIYHRLSATLRKCDIILLRSFTVGVCDKFNRYIGIVVQHLRQQIEPAATRDAMSPCQNRRIYCR